MRLTAQFFLSPLLQFFVVIAIWLFFLRQLQFSLQENRVFKYPCQVSAYCQGATATLMFAFPSACLP